MSTDINDYLRNLIDNSKISKILADDETSVEVNLDLYTGEYKGARVRFINDDRRVDISTEDGRIKVYGDEKSTYKLDTITRLVIDYQVLYLFNINKIDEDYFSDMAENLKADIIEMYAKESKKIEEELKKSLKEIHESDYDKAKIKKILKSYKISEKSDHLLLEKTLNGTHIKFNTDKEKITVKNNFSFKEKFNLEDVVSDFDTNKFIETIDKIYKREKYHQKKLELEEALDDGYPMVDSKSFYYNPEDIDLLEDNL